MLLVIKVIGHAGLQGKLQVQFVAGQPSVRSDKALTGSRGHGYRRVGVCILYPKQHTFESKGMPLLIFRLKH